MCFTFISITQIPVWEKKTGYSEDFRKVIQVVSE